ncbi:MAG: pyridoxal-phosphate dependent enzyme, partial [Thermoanaerobaculia bacterium]
MPCGAPALDPHEVHHLCSCGAPLLARYDLHRARAWSRGSLAGREPNMWRYRELLPLFEGETPVSLGEGFTPLLHAAALGATLGLERLYIKDESLNPTNSFKARGQSAAITRAKYLGAKTIALPTAGNAGNAASAYSAAAGLACEVFIPKDAKRPFIDECRLYGANVTLVDGLITDAGRLCAETGGPLG